MKTGAVGDAGGDGDLKVMAQELSAGAGTVSAPLGPRLASATAAMTRAANRYGDWNGSAFACFARRELQRRTQRDDALLGLEPATHAINSRRHGRKIDDDFIGKTAGVVATLVAADHCDGPAERTEAVAAHELKVR